MNILEKKEKLNDVFNTLKGEFVGLDDILESIKSSITPWYLTPEIINRPLVISLWGMTGTGKSSVVKRLLQLLNLEEKSVTLDCGLESGESSNSGSENIAESIVNKLGLEDYNGDVKDLFSETVFVFDEFQHARTIDEIGAEIDKPSLRPIWGIIDDGQIFIDSNRYEIMRILNQIDDLDAFVVRSKIDPLMKDNYFLDKRELEQVVSSVELKRYYGGDSFPSAIHVHKESIEDSEEEEEKTVPVFDEYYLGFIVKKLNREKSCLGYDFSNEIKQCSRVTELLQVFKKYKKYILKQRVFDCSKSLVFILGNLDEAFKIEKELNPDYDADVFKDITSSVTISDIKTALKKRFRAEQIARFGNNIIKYPTLNKKEFMEVIYKEIERISKEFKNISNIDLKLEEEVIHLLYSEGVYPVQGVRPLFSTIGTIITPFLSDIILEKEEKDTEVIISLKDKNHYLVNNFKIPKTTLNISFNNSKKVLEKDINLQLGSIRNPKNKKTRYITSVHESGHAIVSMFLKGEFPVSIVSVSTDDGGFCDTHVKSELKEIDSKEGIDNEVMICLGGYLAEKLVYKEEEKCLMGSSSDLIDAWEIFSSAVYKCGYIAPLELSNYSVETVGNGLPNGFDIKDTTLISSKNYKSIYIDLINRTKDILSNETKLLKNMSLYLGEHGSLPVDILKEMVEKYGNKLTIDHMEKRKYELSGEYYFNELMKL